MTRFAPSPTGPLHLGHAYAAQVAHDLARAAGGRYLLRIEDIDRQRSKPQWEQALIADLAWLGLAPDAPPIRQSDRQRAYEAALDRLWRLGLLYPCHCTRRDIGAALSAPQESGRPAATDPGLHSGPDGPVYPGTCRPAGPQRPDQPRPRGTHLRLNMRRALEVLRGRDAAALEFFETGPVFGPEFRPVPEPVSGAAAASAGASCGPPPAAVPAALSPPPARAGGRAPCPCTASEPGGTAAVSASAGADDHGHSRWSAGPAGQAARLFRLDPAALCDEIGDVVLARKDFGTSYHLAVVVDDAAQGITLVSRGADLFGATPIHVLLQRLFGVPVPGYHHHQLVRDAAGQRLAKRDDARAIARYREDGLSPGEVLALAAAGHGAAG